MTYKCFCDLEFSVMNKVGVEIDASFIVLNGRARGDVTKSGARRQNGGHTVMLSCSAESSSEVARWSLVVTAEMRISNGEMTVVSTSGVSKICE